MHAMRLPAGSAAVALCMVVLPCFAACPADPSASPETLLPLRFASQAPIRLDRRALAALGEQQLTQRRSVATTAGASAPALEQAIIYEIVALGRVIASGAADDRGAARSAPGCSRRSRPTAIARSSAGACS